MKLAKIKEDLYLNPHNVVSIEFDDEDNTTLITMVNGEVFSLDLPIKKVLDTISGSEEYSGSRERQNDFVYFYYDSDYKKVPIIVGSSNNLQDILFPNNKEKKIYSELVPNNKKIYAGINGQNYVINLDQV